MLKDFMLLRAIVKGGGGITPTGDINITENGEFDVTEFAKAVVNVASGGATTEGYNVIYNSIKAKSDSETLETGIPLNSLKSGDYFYVLGTEDIFDDSDTDKYIQTLNIHHYTTDKCSFTTGNSAKKDIVMATFSNGVVTLSNGYKFKANRWYEIIYRPKGWVKPS